MTREPAGSERMKSRVTFSSLPTLDTRSSCTSTAMFNGVRTRAAAADLFASFGLALAVSAVAPNEAATKTADARTEYNFFMILSPPARLNARAACDEAPHSERACDGVARPLFLRRVFTRFF